MNPAVATELATVEAPLYVWMAIHGHVCLALRHPENQGEPREMGNAFVDRIGRLLVERGLLTQQELEEAQQLEREMSHQVRS